MRLLDVPPAIEVAGQMGAAFIISVSGGKDSQAIIKRVSRLARFKGWPGVLVAIHADLGRIEWSESLPHCQALAEQEGMDLMVVRRAKGELMLQMKQRMEQLAGTGKPFWPSAQARYCTSDQKRGPIEKYLRNFPLVVSVEGIRAAESKAREGKPVVAVRKRVTGKALRSEGVDRALRLWEPDAGRLALTWYPIHGWTEADVYEDAGWTMEELNWRRAMYREGRRELALEGWTMHPAYVRGNERVSCALCVLASLNDVRNGAVHRPDLYHELRLMEVKGGATFKNGKSLTEIVE